MNKKNLKSLLQNKQKIIGRATGYPAVSSGRDGDFQVRRIPGQGIFLFYKWNNRWYSSRLNQYRPKTAEHKEPVRLPVGVKPIKEGDLSLNKGKVSVGKSGSKTNQIISVNTSKVIDSDELILSRNKDSGSAATSDFLIKNTGTGRAYLHIQTQNASADPYILMSYLAAGETPALKQWAIGMDNSNSDTLTFAYKSSGTDPLTPSTTTASEIEMELSSGGNLSTTGTLTIGTINTDTAGDNYLVEVSGEVKKRTPAQVLSDIGAQAAGNYITGTGSLSAQDLTDIGNLSGTNTGDQTLPTNYITNDADDEMLGTLTLKKASDDATCRELIFLKERASSVSSNDGDLAGEITFKAYNDAGSPELIEVAQISATFADVSDSNETGKLEFKVAPPDEFSENNTAVTGLTLQGAGGNYTHVDVSMGTSQGTVAHDCPDNIFRYNSSSSSGRMLFQPSNPGAGGTTNTTFIMEAWNDADDIFKILIDDAAATTISTVDDGGVAGHLTLDIDGDITLDAASGNIYVKDNGGNYTPGSDYEIATKKYVDDNAGGGGSGLNSIIASMVFG